MDLQIMMEPSHDGSVTSHTPENAHYSLTQSPQYPVPGTLYPVPAFPSPKPPAPDPEPPTPTLRAFEFGDALFQIRVNPLGRVLGLVRLEEHLALDGQTPSRQSIQKFSG